MEQQKVEAKELTQGRHMYYMVALPAGHGSVDWIIAGLFILMPAVAFDGVELSPGKIGLLFTIRAIGSTLGYIPAGIVGDSLNRQGIALVATFWWVGLAAVAASFSPNYWALVLALSVYSLGNAFWHPLAMGAMVQRMPGRRATAMAVHGIGGTLSEVLAPLMVGFLLIALEWREVLLINAAIPLTAGILLFNLAGMKRGSSESRISLADLRNLGRVGKRPLTLGVLLAMTLFNLSVNATMSMTPVYLKDIRHFSSGESGLAFAGLLLAGAIGAPILGAKSDKIGRRRITLVGLGVAGAGMWAMTLMPESISLVVIMLIVGFFLISIRNVLAAAALDVFGHRESTVIGFLFAIGEGVGALGSLIAGTIGNSSLSWALVFAAFMAFASGILTGALPLKAPGKTAYPGTSLTEARS